jgi:hypothetical protein
LECWEADGIPQSVSLRSYAWFLDDQHRGEQFMLSGGRCAYPTWLADSKREQRANRDRQRYHIAQATPQELEKQDNVLRGSRGFVDGTMFCNPFHEKEQDLATQEAYGEIDDIFGGATDEELKDWVPSFVSDKPSEREDARRLCAAYTFTVFNPVLPKLGALVTPLKLDIIPENHHLLKCVTNRKLVGDRYVFGRAQCDSWMDIHALREAKGVLHTAAPVHIAQKPATWKDGERIPGAYRFCLDYRVSGLNEATRTEAWAMPYADEILGQMVGAEYFAVFDARQGFTQIRMHKDSVRYTAFSLNSKMYECLRVPFGLKNAPSHFQRIMTTEVLPGLVGEILEVFIDDIVVYAKTHDELMKNIETFLNACAAKRIHLKAPKCIIGAREVPLLGHIVDGHGIRLSEDRKQGINALVMPTTLSKLRTFLGMANYFHKFIPDYARVAKVLTQSCSTIRPFIMEAEHRVAFGILKQCILDSPVLAHIRPEKELFLRTDASEEGCGGYLFQLAEDGVTEQVVTYVSRSFNSTEQKWSTIELSASISVLSISNTCCLVDISSSKPIMRTCSTWTSLRHPKSSAGDYDSPHTTSRFDTSQAS